MTTTNESPLAKLFAGTSSKPISDDLDRVAKALIAHRGGKSDTSDYLLSTAAQTLRLQDQLNRQFYQFILDLSHERTSGEMDERHRDNVDWAGAHEYLVERARELLSTFESLVTP